MRILHRLDVLENEYAIPEELTRCLLCRFEVNGAQPLLESRVQDMITNANNSLRDVLLAEIRSSRGTALLDRDVCQGGADPESIRWPAGTLVDGHMQWTWGGRMHMVPRGWCLPKGTVSMLFNLWVNGNPAMQIQPYRFLKGWDLVATEDKAGAKIPMVLSPEMRKTVLETTSRTWRSYLTQATDVMLVMQQECGTTWQRLSALTAQAREQIFIVAFQKVIRRLHSDEVLDAKRLYDN